jgi:hypothetical protein
MIHTERTRLSVETWVFRAAIRLQLNNSNSRPMDMAATTKFKHTHTKITIKSPKSSDLIACSLYINSPFRLQTLMLRKNLLSLLCSKNNDDDKKNLKFKQTNTK